MGQLEVRLRCSSFRHPLWMVCPHGSTAVGRTLSNRYSQHTCRRGNEECEEGKEKHSDQNCYDTFNNITSSQATNVWQQLVRVLTQYPLPSATICK